MSRPVFYKEKGLMILFLILFTSFNQFHTINYGISAKPEYLDLSGEDKIDLSEIMGNQTALIQNTTLTLNGPLFVRDNATLRIINSWIHLGEVRDEEGAHIVEVVDSGMLEVFNSTIYGNQEDVRWINLRGSSSAVLREARFLEVKGTRYPGETFPRLLAFDCASLRAESCHLWVLGIYHNVTSTIEGSRIDNLAPYSSVPALIHNSTIGRMRLSFEAEAITITGNYQILQGHVDSGDILPGHPREFNFVLHDSKLDTLTLAIWGRPQKLIDVVDAEADEIWIDGPANVTVVGSRLGRLVMSERGDLFVRVQGSEIDSLSAWMEIIDAGFQHSRLGRVSIDGFFQEKVCFENCTVGNYVHYRWTGEGTFFEETILGNLTLPNPVTTPLCFRNCAIEGDIVSTREASSKVAIEGDLRFGPTSTVRVPPEGNLEVTRTYVTVVRRDGAAVQGAVLELRKGETSIWRRLTDEQGMAIFTLSYEFGGTGEGSYPVQLLVDGAEVAEVDLFTGTPIVIDLPRERDYGSIVWLFLSLVLAALFGYLVFVLRKIVRP
jgi:hypothetical protein